MPSHTNPNKPSTLKPRHVAATKAKRKRQSKRVNDSAPKTSQAIRKAAPLSKKKARKLEKKIGYARQRAVEEEFEKREVEMRDVAERTKESRDGRAKGQEEELMDLDGIS